MPVIPLAGALAAGEAWTRPKSVVYLWAVVELLFVTNPWQISSRLRVEVLKAFGASIGSGVIFRPRTRVKFPWNLVVGDDSWIGEGVWFHNQANILVGRDVVISQDTLMTTGSHDVRRDMKLLTKEIVVEDGAWITSRCVILGGTRIGRSSVIRPNTVISRDVPPNLIYPPSSSEPEQRFNR